MINTTKITSYYIYFHKNSKTLELFYIGYGSNQRAYEFKSGRNQHWKNYVAKHGEPIVEIIHNFLDHNQVYFYEEYYIALYGRIGYEPWGILVNKSSGGTGGKQGFKDSDETRKKKSEWRLGMKFSNETCNKISEKKKGYKYSKSRDLKIGEKQKNKPKSNSRKIIQYDLEGNFIQEWEFTKLASETLKLNDVGINNNLKNRCNSSGGFIWKYKE